MPREHFGAATEYLAKPEILTFEEIARIVESALPLGLRKVRITGGEPLLRRDLPELIRQLRRFPVELALTTNGHRLAALAQRLKDAGLDRVSVSLDALDPTLYEQITDGKLPVSRVLEGIERAQAVGLAPVKVNAVIRRNCNENQIRPLVRYFTGKGPVVRFIEFMDVGDTNDWQRASVVTGAEILSKVEEEFVLDPVPTHSFEAVAERWRVRNSDQEIGIISSVSRPFCRGCTRLRLAANGQLHRCLFASDRFDIRPALRDVDGQADLTEILANLWRTRDDRYSELRMKLDGLVRKPEMSYLGG